MQFWARCGWSRKICISMEMAMAGMSAQVTYFTVGLLRLLEDAIDYRSRFSRIRDRG